MDRAELIELANERMGIVQACNHIGMGLPDYLSSSMKVDCPFGSLYHLDGGASRSMRVYAETNSAWCFAGCGYFTPVRLIADDQDLSEEDAAQHILDITNYVPPDFESQWEALMAEVPVVNTASLAEALKVACSRMAAGWEDLQFSSEVSAKLTACFALLPHLRTPEQAQRWLDVSKFVMQSVLQNDPS